MAHAIDVARFFIDIANAIPTCDLMTNLRVNKLLYFAQGECLRELGHPLFDDGIEAWTYGPVVPCVYKAYKHFGREPIKDDAEVSENALTEQEKDVLFDVLRHYGRFDTSTLVSMSHQKKSPWDVMYRRNNKHAKIPNDLIKLFFESQPPISKFKNPYKPSDCVGYRDKDGYLVLPKELDDE